MIHAVIFDMDGLLIDSEPMWQSSEIEIFKNKGVTLTEHDCQKTKGMRLDEVVSAWTKQFPEANIQINETIIEVMNAVSTLVQTQGNALPGVYSTLAFFKQINIPMALASASNFNLIHTVIDKLNIRPMFQVIESAEKMQYGKPHPEIFIETARKLNVKPENCLVFEDSIFGVIAAKAAKMKVVAVPERDNYNNAEFALANLKIPTLEWFTKSIFDQLNQ